MSEIRDPGELTPEEINVLGTAEGHVILSSSETGLAVIKAEDDPSTVLAEAGLGDPAFLENLLPRIEAMRRPKPERTPTQELAALRPRLVPSDYFDAGLPGPHVELALPGMSLSWVLWNEDRGTYTYVTDEMVTRWEAAGVDWQATALDNLGPDDEVFTHMRQTPDGRPAFALALHNDGLGPARLLRHDAVATLFPEGYRVALPEMGAGMALSNHAPADLVAEFAKTVEHFHTHGGSPLTSEWFQPGLLQPT